MKSTGLKLFLIVLIGTILVGVAVAVTYFCFRKIDFNVIYNDETVSAQSFSFDCDNSYKFSVKGRGDYQIKILTNSQKDFTFLKDGEQVAFSSLGDVTEKFGVKYGKKGFTLTVSNDALVIALIEQTFSESVIELPEGVNLGKDYFVLRATNMKTGEEISCTFGVNGIYLSEKEIII